MNNKGPAQRNRLIRGGYQAREQITSPERRASPFQYVRETGTAFIADRANAIALDDGPRAIVFGWETDLDINSVVRANCRNV